MFGSYSLQSIEGKFEVISNIHVVLNCIKFMLWKTETENGLIMKRIKISHICIYLFHLYWGISQYIKKCEM